MYIVQKMIHHSLLLFLAHTSAHLLQAFGHIIQIGLPLFDFSSQLPSFECCAQLLRSSPPFNLNGCFLFSHSSSFFESTLDDGNLPVLNLCSLMWNSFSLFLLSIMILPPELSTL